ncbi:major facilitator superfamily-domain-containing protein [Hyaloraphidium curvatum]|nr:major facilitator superfamily-domain-containing protein [Hyaloraphidium curvatum]
MCALAPSMVVLIVGRGFQGVGGGGLQALVYVMVSEVVTLRERGTYTAIMGAIAGAGAMVGPLVGGVITDNWSWRGAFWINLPVGALALAGYFFLLPRTARRKATWRETLARVDYGGAILCVAGVVGLLLGLTWGVTAGWVSAQTLVPLILGAIIVIAFVLYEWKVPKEPSVPMRLFASVNISCTYAANFFVGWMSMSGGYRQPLFFQLVLGNTPTASGLKTIPSIAVLIPVSIVTGIVSSKTGIYVPFPKVGLAIAAVGVGLMTTWNAGTPVGEQIGYLCIQGFGLGLSLSMLMLIVQANLPLADIGPGTTVMTFMSSVGGVLGIGVGGTILANIVAGQLSSAAIVSAAAALGIDPAVLGECVQAQVNGQPLQPSSTVPASAVQAASSMVAAAYEAALSKVFLSMAVATCAGWVAVMFIRHVPLRTTMDSTEIVVDSGKDTDPEAAAKEGAGGKEGDDETVVGAEQAGEHQKEALR